MSQRKSRPLHRYSKRVKIPKECILTISHPRNSARYWMEVLDQCRANNKQSVLFDPLVVRDMERALTECTNRAKEALAREFNRILRLQSGDWRGGPRYGEWPGAGKYSRRYRSRQPSSFSDYTNFGGYWEAWFRSPMSKRPDGTPLDMHRTDFRFAGRRRVVWTPGTCDLRGFLESLTDKELWLWLTRYHSHEMVQTVVVQRANRRRREGTDFILDGRPMTLKELAKIPNAELRRAVAEGRGLDLGGKQGVTDDYGTLYRVPNRPFSILAVTCPSTGRQYTLGVPSSCSTPREAVLWTFNLERFPVDSLTLEAEA